MKPTPMTRITLEVPTAHVKKLDAIARMMSNDKVKITRLNVIRQAIKVVIEAHEETQQEEQEAGA